MHSVLLSFGAFCAFCFAEAVSLILSVLTMLWRDVRKLVTSLMRMLMYFSPVIWECHFEADVPYSEVLNFIMQLNPVYYIINGYREAVFYKVLPFEHMGLTLYFWGVVVVLFAIGSLLMFKFKTKFSDLI